MVSWLLLALQLALAAVLFLAATGKALRPDEFMSALRLSHLPTVAVRPIAVAVPVVELALAAALVLGPANWLPGALVATAALLGAFTVWMGWVRTRHLRVRCGCFGPGGAEIGGRTIGRNLLLALLAIAGMLLAMRTQSPLPGPSLAMAVAATSLAMCLALVDALRAAWPDLAVTFDRLHAGDVAAPGGG
jgi:hypothetical protein